MNESDTGTASLQPRELEAVYAISRAVAGAVDTETALNEIIRLARPVFIFDNMVLYVQQEGAAPEPIFARAIGRGRFLEADLAWGEVIANDAYQSAETITRLEKLPEADEDRTKLRYLLGLPLKIGDKVMGSLVFIRFGSPPYTSEQIHLAEFITVHVAQLLDHRKLVERVANLEAKRRLDNLQDDFIATISHELLTPLGFIKGYATTLLRDDTNWDADTYREFLTIIDEEADRLRELIDNLMDSSRLQSGTLRISFQPVRVEALLRDIALRASSRDDSLKINLKLNAPGLQIQADPTRLAQVFENLLSNARKYAPGSSILISLETVDDMAKISVRDNGPGIPEEHLKNIFQRFYRVPGDSTSIRGTGLGLYIVRQIIHAHHGEINVESKVGEGTTFNIYLPCDRTSHKSNSSES
jgi:signal transduction histidine kinase